MPQKLPPRLVLKHYKSAGRERKPYWVIVDDNRQHGTGCAAAEVEKAGRALADYIASKHVVTHGGSAREVMIADVLSVYLDEKALGTAAPQTTVQIIGRLASYWGGMTVSEIKRKSCMDYVAHRGTEAGARKDLEFLRAAVNYYHGEHTLDAVPKITLPQKSLPRERYLTRSEVAALLWAALGWKRTALGKWVRDHMSEYRGLYSTSSRGRRYYYAWREGPKLPGVPGSPEFKAAFDDAYASPGAPKRPPATNGERRRHIARLIIIGLYTGTRPGAILALQKMPNTEGGHANLETGVIHRKAQGERVAHNKAKPPVKMAPSLLAHMKRWARLDQGIRWYVHYNGQPIEKLNKAWRGCCRAAGLDPEEVVPHILRHTRGTWLAQAGVDHNQAASSLGMTVEEYERTYSHVDPDFQKDAANAF